MSRGPVDSVVPAKVQNVEIDSVYVIPNNILYVRQFVVVILFDKFTIK